MKSKCFVVNIPTHDLLAAVMVCGKVSGRDVDKFTESGLCPEKAGTIDAVKVRECAGSIECKLIDRWQSGDHFVFVGEAWGAEAEEDLYQNGRWAIPEAQLLFHLGADSFFGPGESFTARQRRS